MPDGRSPTAHLAVVCNTLCGGGVSRVVSTLCNAWSRQGRKVYLITLRNYEGFFHLEPSIHRVDTWTCQKTSGVSRFRRKSSNLLARTATILKHFGLRELSDRLFLHAGSLWLSQRIGSLRAAIQQTEAPVIIAFGSEANILTILACRNLGRKVVISERNDVARRLLEYPWEQLRVSLYNRADMVTGNTLGALKTLGAYVDEEKLAFVPNPLVHEETRADSPHVSAFEAPFVLIVASLNRIKAHDVLLEAFARLLPELPNWRLAIVGAGEQEKTLQEQARALGVAERVDWYGQVANPFAFYRAASIFALPSRSEGMPNALMEAMSCGLPVIVSNASQGPQDLVKDNETGLVVPVDDVPALAKAIELLANDATLRKRLGDAGRRRVSEYDLSKVMPIWERIISCNHGSKGPLSCNR